MSICTSVVYNSIRRGVLCMDVRLSELLSNIQYFREGELSYAFLIDGTGRVLLHYLQPYPSAYKTDPDPIDIHTLERGNDAAMVIKSMKRSFLYYTCIAKTLLINLLPFARHFFQIGTFWHHFSYFKLLWLRITEENLKCAYRQYYKSDLRG